MGKNRENPIKLERLIRPMTKAQPGLLLKFTRIQEKGKIEKEFLRNEFL